MDFSPSEDQAALREAVRSFARKEIAPGYLTRAKKAEFPWREHRMVADMGILGLLAGPEWGGTDHPDFEMCGIAMEELAYADFNVSNCVLPPLIITSILREHASRAMQEEWIPKQVSGEAVVALGLTEPGSGSDAAAMRTSARKSESGWVINGEKTSITAIPFAEAIVVFAVTDRTRGARGVSTFMVPTSASTLR